jgi:signal transduction histidine kinase
MKMTWQSLFDHPGAVVDGASPHAAVWPWLTIALSSSVIAGYCVIAFNWYFQSKMAHHAEARAALSRLRNICVACIILAYTFFATDVPWLIWRAYDALLFVLVCYTWSFVFRSRGLSLVSERLSQMDELERSAQKYREIAELLPHVVWTADHDGDVDFCNQSWREYVGDGFAQHPTWLDAIHPDEISDATAGWHHAVATRSPLSLEVRLGGVCGYRTFVVRAMPIAHGDVVKWLGACADIEDQKRLAAEKEAQAKQKSFFLNALSHDLRAPLNNVVLNAHLLKLSVRDPADVESVTAIIDNAIAAGDLVTKLLDFARVGAEQVNVMETVSLSATLHQIVRRFQPVSDQKGLQLRVAQNDRGPDTAHDPDVRILTDRLKLERIVSNLVDNAIKYTQRGSVTVGMLAQGDEVTVRVSDTGAGIPGQNVPYLFDEFYQVNNYERDRSKGFGMGLNICKSLARHLGGDVRLASTGEQGSCFELVIKDQRPDRGGRPLGAAGDHADPAGSGLCRV